MGESGEKPTKNPTYDFCWSWLYKERSGGSIADVLFVYVDDRRLIDPTEEVCWEASKK